MPVSANVYGNNGLAEGVARLGDIFNPATIQAKQLAQAQGEEAMQGIQSARKLRDFMSQNPNAGLQDLTAAARSSGNLAAASQFQSQDIAAKKAALEGQQTQLKIVKQKLDNVSPLLGAVFANPTNEFITATMGAAEQRGEIPAGTTQQFISLPNDPMARRQLIVQHGLDPAHLMEQVTPKPTQVNGQIVDMNPSTNPGAVGTVVPRQAAPLSEAEKMHDATTRRGQNMVDARERQKNMLGGFDPVSGSFTAGQGAPAAGGGLSGMVDALGQYKLNPSQAFARMPPTARAQLISQVQAKYPDYDPTTYDAKSKAAKDFSTGQQGNAMRSFATAGQHLDQLGKLVDALGNGNMQLVNQVSNIYSQQTGSPAVTNFDAAKDVVSKEVVKAIVASGGGVAERQELSDLMKNVKSPAQLKGVIAQYRDLMGAQYENLVAQRKAAGVPDTTLPKYPHGGETPKGSSSTVGLPPDIAALMVKHGAKK